MSREVKVGLLVLAALVVLAVGTFMVGDRENIFARKNSYFVRFPTVVGLAEGNPVQLNGVNVGQVSRIVLPEEVAQQQLTVWLTVERRFEERVRADSLARIKTLGLLGDKYIEISSGSADQPVIPSGGEIPAAPATDVDKLIASGEDVVENVVAISVSLRSVLGRMEAGQGILGELTTDTEAGRRAKEAMVSTLESVRTISGRIESGDGTLATLINERNLLDRIDGALGRLEGVLAKLDEGEGALPALLNDPATRAKVESAVEDLSHAAGNFAELSDGRGLLARLMTDEEYAEELGEDLRQLIHNLNLLSAKLERGEGTLGQMINDPQVYQAIDDILVGINESKLLRWLIRNRQKKGIKVRYKEAPETLEVAPADEEVGG